MMTRKQRQAQPYTPESDAMREAANGLRWYNRAIKPSEIMSALALLGSLLVVLGWEYRPASKQIASEAVARAAADDLIRADVTTNRAQIDTLRIQQTFTNFLICDARRANTPRSVPDECLKILSTWGVRR